MASGKDFVLILREVAYHPISFLLKLGEKFESISILHITGKDELKRYQKPPLFNSKYLVVFEDLKTFESNYELIKFSTMFVVLHLDTGAKFDEAVFVCQEKQIPFKVYFNAFTKEMAYRLIRDNATEQVSDSFCKTVVRQVGLNPLRILTAVGVCEQMGYSESVITKYVDRWMYLDIRKLIECLLGIPPSKAAMRSSLAYLHLNRHWYRFVAENILDELNVVLRVYKDKLAGLIPSQLVLSYAEEHRITRSRILYALQLFDRVSITSILALNEFIKKSSLLEVVLHLM